MLRRRYLSGKGVARQRKAIVDGLKESVLEFNDGVAGTSPADVMQLMMVTQYLGVLSLFVYPSLTFASPCRQPCFLLARHPRFADMLKEVGMSSKSNTVFLPHGPGAVSDVQAQMRNGFLEANAVIHAREP